MKKLILGLMILASSVTFANASEKKVAESKTAKTEVSTKTIASAGTAVETKVDSSCFTYTMTGDNGSISGTWCGSWGGFMRLVDAFLAE